MTRAGSVADEGLYSRRRGTGIKLLRGKARGRIPCSRRDGTGIAPLRRARGVLFDLYHRCFSEKSMFMFLPQSSHRGHFRSFGLQGCHSKVVLGRVQHFIFQNQSHLVLKLLHVLRARVLLPPLLGQKDGISTPCTFSAWSEILSRSSVRFMKESSTSTIGGSGTRCCLRRSAYKGSFRALDWCDRHLSRQRWAPKSSLQALSLMFQEAQRIDDAHRSLRLKSKEDLNLCYALRLCHHLFLCSPRVSWQEPFEHHAFECSSCLKT